MCGGVGGVDDGEGVVKRGEDAADGGFEQGIVGAAEQEGFGGGSFGESFVEVDLEDFVGDGVVDPAFFDERDEQGAGLLGGVEAEGGEGTGVGVGLDGGGGGEYEGAAGGRRGGEGGFGSGLDDADDRDGQGLLELGQRERGGGVAGDDEEVGSLRVEELCTLDGVAGDGLAGLGAVGEAGGVAEIDVVRGGDEGKQGSEDGEAAKALVEDADGEFGLVGHGWAGL
jgi:hypothetical protein